MNLRTLCAVITLLVGLQVAGVADYSAHRALAKDAIAAENLDDAKAMLDRCYGQDRTIVRACLQEELGMWLTEHGSRDAVQDKFDANFSKKMWLGLLPTFIGGMSAMMGFVLAATSIAEWNHHTYRLAEGVEGFAKSRTYGDIAFLKSGWLTKYHLEQSVECSNQVKYGAIACAAGLLVFALGHDALNSYERVESACKKDVATFDRIKTLIEYLG